MGLPIGSPITVGAAAIPSLQKPLVVSLQLVIEDDSFDACSAPVEALGGANIRAIELGVVFELARLPNPDVEGLALIAWVAAAGLEKVPTAIGQDDGNISTAMDADCVDKAGLTQLSEVTRARVEGPLAIIDEVTGGHHSERADCRQCAALGAAQLVLVLTDVNALTVRAARQVKLFGEDIARFGGYAIARLAISTPTAARVGAFGLVLTWIGTPTRIVAGPH